MTGGRRSGQKQGPNRNGLGPAVYLTTLVPAASGAWKVNGLSPAASLVRILSEVPHEREECRRLSDEESHVRQELAYAPGDVLCFGRANDGTRRQLSTDERARLRHDQVGLKILAAKRRGIQVRKGDRHAGHWIHGSLLRRVARLISPGLEMHSLGGTNADQDSQNFRMRCALRHRGIEGGATLFDGRKVETCRIRDDLKEVGIAGVGVGPGNGRVLPFV